MPEPVNPYREPSGGYSGDAPVERYVWRDCDAAWRAWLASDEALERATAAIATVDEKMAHESGGIVVCAGEEQQARAVLTALRGDGDVDDPTRRPPCRTTPNGAPVCHPVTP